MIQYYYLRKIRQTGYTCVCTAEYYRRAAGLNSAAPVTVINTVNHVGSNDKINTQCD